MGKKNLRRPGRYLTFRLFEDDKRILQGISKEKEGVEDRHAALLELADIAATTKFPDIRGQKRKPLRIRIPEKLDQAIQKIVDETGQAHLHVLLELAREYHRRCSTGPTTGTAPPSSGGEQSSPQGR